MPGDETIGVDDESLAGLEGLPFDRTCVEIKFRPPTPSTRFPHRTVPVAWTNAVPWYLGNRASAGLARFASRGGAAADPFGAPPAADTEVIQRRGNHAPAPVPAAAPMDRKGR